MDLALNNLQRLICHKNPTNQPTNNHLCSFNKRQNVFRNEVKFYIKIKLYVCTYDLCHFFLIGRLKNISDIFNLPSFKEYVVCVANELGCEIVVSKFEHQSSCYETPFLLPSYRLNSTAAVLLQE